MGSVVPRPGRPLLLLDYDGTLAPIVPDPASAYPHPQVPELLRQLIDRGIPLYVVTGRRVEDLARLLPVPRLPVVGVHGLEEGEVGGPVRRHLPQGAAEALEAVRCRLPPIPGLRVEDKGLSLALHYRGLPDEEAAERALTRWASHLPEGLEALAGKKVLEVRPRGAGKGEAVRALAGRHPGRIPVYLGDDLTDEQAFLALGSRAVTVKVGPGPTVARYRLPDVPAAVDYLKGYLR